MLIVVFRLPFIMQQTVLRTNSLFVINKQIFRTVTVARNAVEAKEDVELKSWREIPGPSSLPLIGPLRHFLSGGFLHNLNGTELTQKLYNTYGDIVRLDALVGMRPIVMLFDPESVSKILREENTLPIRPGFISLQYYRKSKRGNRRLLGVVTDDGPNWKEFRSMVNPVLLQPKTIKLYTNTLNEVALEMVERIRKIKDDESRIQSSFDQLLNLWSLESIGTIALGCRMGCLAPDLQEDSPAKKLVKCVQGIMKAGDELDFKPSIWKYYPTKAFRRAMEVYQEQEVLAKYFIDKSIKEFKSKPKSDDEKGVLEKLMEINEEVAYIMASDMLIAGVDTTANTMLATLYLLASNPEKQHKLREELKSEQRAYLRACLKEAIRMMPIAAGNMRQTTKEYNILGYKLPVGLQVALAHQDMSNMEKHFKRSKEYIPERWLVDSTDPLYYRNAHPFAYNPFGFGVRGCIGRRIAESELEILLTRIIENFQLEWTGPPPRLVQTALNYVKGPYYFKFTDLKK